MRSFATMSPRVRLCGRSAIARKVVQQPKLSVKAHASKKEQQKGNKSAAPKAQEPAEPEATSGSTSEQEATDSSSPSESASGSEEELDVVEKLRLCIRAKDLDGAESLVDAVVAEVGALASIVEAAEAQSRATQVSLDQVKDQYKRLQADFDNFRTRANLEKQQSTVNAKMSVIEDLLPVVDGFELASSQVKTESPGEEKINNSYQAMYKKMVDVFRGMGLEAVATEGHPFDPEVHDGIMREESTEVENGVVLQEFRKGFMFKDKLLRPAMVKVAYREDAPAAPAAESASAESDSSANDK